MITVANASVVFKDKNGNVGTVKGASANDVTKIRTAISDVAQVVDPTSHLPINATTSSVGVVQLADAAAVAAGTAGRVIDAAQLKDAIEHVTPAGNLMTTDTAQTVTAVKTFSSLPESSVVPTTNNQLVNKKYVDDHATPTPSNMVTTDTAQTITGLKTFSTLPRSSVTPTLSNELSTKAYVDDNFVTLGTVQTIQGKKTFTHDIVFTDPALRILRNDDDKYLIFVAGASSDTSSSIAIDGIDRNDGSIYIRARDSNSNLNSIQINANGTITWNSKDIKTVMANSAMPSSTSNTLTVGSSGTSYTAPADGYFSFSSSSSDSSQANFIGLSNSNTGIATRCSIVQGTYAQYVFMPASKGDSVTISYGGNSYSFSLSFVYANGS